MTGGEADGVPQCTVTDYRSPVTDPDARVVPSRGRSWYNNLVQDFRKLRAWREAIQLAGVVYRVTDGFPEDERYSLTAQMRRSAGSIASNIAEGCGRETKRDFARFLRMAYASACEVETHAHVALEAGIGDGEGVSAKSFSGARTCVGSSRASNDPSANDARERVGDRCPVTGDRIA